MIYDDDENANDFILTLLCESKFYHYKLEHLEDSYFRLPDLSIMHGLDSIVEMLSLNKKFLPCKLKSFAQGRVNVFFFDLCISQRFDVLVH